MNRRKLLIAFAASEMAPFAKTGGMADVTGVLPREIRKLGAEVVCFLPKYKKIDVRRWPLKEVINRLRVPMGSEAEHGKVFRHVGTEGIPTYLIDPPDYFGRDELYGTPAGDYPDNDRRFTFFQRGVLETLRQLGIRPDILHCHDWQTGLLPVYLKRLYAADPLFSKTRSVFTIHNLCFQGNFPPDSLPLTGLSWEEYKLERLEFYGKISFLKGGLVYADALTTVSPRYGQEIQSKEYGCGLEGVLHTRKKDLTGILNGIDPEEWNPETDPDIPSVYSLKKLEGKAENKAALQKLNQFEVSPKVPLLGVVTRLTEQKGVDLLALAMEELMERGVQLMILGTGDEKYQHIFKALAKKYSNQLATHILFDPKLAKKVYAGCDIFLMPSRFEPCGLGQLIALRYGTAPIVRETGGLSDSVKDFSPETGEGTGFVFRPYQPEAFLGAVDRALKVFADAKAWQKLIKNGMKCDFSWYASAEKYFNLYEKVERRAAGV